MAGGGRIGSRLAGRLFQRTVPGPLVHLPGPRTERERVTDRRRVGYASATRPVGDNRGPGRRTPTQAVHRDPRAAGREVSDAAARSGGFCAGELSRGAVRQGRYGAPCGLQPLGEHRRTVDRAGRRSSRQDSPPTTRLDLLGLGVRVRAGHEKVGRPPGGLRGDRAVHPRNRKCAAHRYSALPTREACHRALGLPRLAGPVERAQPGRMPRPFRAHGRPVTRRPRSGHAPV